MSKRNKDATIIGLILLNVALWGYAFHLHMAHKHNHKNYHKERKCFEWGEYRLEPRIAPNGTRYWTNTRTCRIWAPM